MYIYHLWCVQLWLAFEGKCLLQRLWHAELVESARGALDGLVERGLNSDVAVVAAPTCIILVSLRVECTERGNNYNYEIRFRFCSFLVIMCPPLLDFDEAVVAAPAVSCITSLCCVSNARRTTRCYMRAYFPFKVCSPHQL